MNRLYNNLRKIVCLSLLFVINSDFGLAQNIKKVYKQISKREINDANNELKQFSTASLDNKELTLYDLANCLVMCNPLLPNNDPLKSNGMFEKIDFTKSSKLEVNEFLEKFELSIDKIHDTIYTRILDYAKKQNTETSYTSALTVCTNCFYKEEVTKLQVNSAYNETIKKASIPGYKEFISKYPNSEFRNEIQHLEEAHAFTDAKTKNSLIGFKNYIEGYSSTSNQYLPLAINHRDSIVFFTLKQSYDDYKNFSLNNPQSKYSPIAIKELPNVLYNQAKEGHNIYLFEKYLHDFENGSHKDSVIRNLERLYYEKLKDKSYSKEKEIKFYRVRFPNSPYIQNVNDLFENYVRTDVKKMELLGKVRSYNKNVYNANFISNKFNKGDKISEKRIVFDNQGNKIEESINGKLIYSMVNNKEERFFFKPDGDSILSHSTSNYDDYGNVIEHIEYNSDGTIERSTAKFDIYGNNIELIKYLPDGKNVLVISKKCDSIGRIIEEINTLSKDKTTYKYDENNNTIELCKYKLDGSLVSKQTHEYNKDGKFIEYINQDTRETHKYDNIGNVVEHIVYKKSMIKQIETTKYNEDGKQVESTFYKPDGNKSGWFTIKYNEKGEIIGSIAFNADGSLRQKFEYNKDGKIIEFYESNYDGKQISKDIYKYNEIGQIIEEISMGNDNLKYRKIYKYDANGNEIECCKVSQRGSTGGKSKVISKYDSNGIKIEVLTYIFYEYDCGESNYNNDCKIRSKEITTYDEKGRMIENILTNSDGIVEGKSIYKYDANGNLILELIYNNHNRNQNKPFQQIREITLQYYQ